MSTSRGRPPRLPCLAGGIMGSTIAHCASVRSDVYVFRDWFAFAIFAHSPADGRCANSLINLLFCQALFPDSLLVLLGPSGCGDAPRRRMIAGLENPPAGDILIAGQVVPHLPPRARKIAMVFQSY